MNSKVHNAFTVLVIGSALVLGLFVASSSMFPIADFATAPSGDGFAATTEVDAAPVADEAMIATLTAETPGGAGLAAPLQDTATTPAAMKQSRHESGKSSHIRQSMAMPFFSFAPRG